MELTQLRYFQAVAEHGTMTAAARTLGVSQPALTVSLQKLEGHLNTTLLYRDRRGTRLTESGRELLTWSREVFLLLEQAEERVRGLEQAAVGRFVIGCPEVLGAYFLPSFMAEFLDTYPRIEVTLWNGPSPDVHRAVLDRTVQFGLLVNPLPHPDLVLLDLFDDATDSFVPLDATPAPTAAAAQERLLAGPLVYVEGLPQSRQLLEALAQRQLLPARRLVCGDLELVKSLVLGGVGVGVVPRRVAANGQNGRLRRLHPELPFVPDRIHLIFRGDLHRTRGAKILKDALVAQGRAMGRSAAAERE